MRLLDSELRHLVRHGTPSHAARTVACHDKVISRLDLVLPGLRSCHQTAPIDVCDVRLRLEQEVYLPGVLLLYLGHQGAADVAARARPAGPHPRLILPQAHPPDACKLNELPVEPVRDIEVLQGARAVPGDVDGVGAVGVVARRRGVVLRKIVDGDGSARAAAGQCQSQAKASWPGTNDCNVRPHAPLDMGGRTRQLRICCLATGKRSGSDMLPRLEIDTAGERCILPNRRQN
mmetsp:Transcript_14153/g.36317  ORF Transcript_14153/g.36317 Transcript_14153/m.36317 type:complete len:233 (-) Transcript_14153:184-882(-)